MEAKIAARKAELDAQLAIKEVEQEAVRKEKEALLLKQEADKDDIAERKTLKRIHQWQAKQTMS